MDIKSTSYYRRRYMIDVRHCKENDDHNLAFVGHEFLNENGEYEKGFFDLVHGDKSDIRNFIAQHLKNAEDGQAIYEFLQNAEDAKSSSFMAFYNDNYFLAVNNGNAFTKNGIRAILNVAQSDKKDSSMIGRFGIGFKLVHRLVGEGEGLDELLQEYRGPVLFSWSREDDLLRLMNKESINPVNDVSDDSPLPYLFKILITSFPAGVDETIFDIEHKERVGFTQDEYEELSHAVSDNLRQYLGQGLLKSGSLFFIKLGKGKKEKLDNNFESELKVGVEYSLNTLSHIQNVIINGTSISKVELEIEKGCIEKGSDQFLAINPEYKDSDIHYSVGYRIDFNSENPFTASERLKTSPTFYKFFPLGDEIHSSALFIHCDALSNQTNRRKLQDDNTNRALLPVVAGFIEERLSQYEALRDWDAFRQLYASILLTDRAHDNSAWLNTCYFDLLPAILKGHIPVIETDGSISYTPNSKNVRVRKIKSNIPLSVVNDSLRWFAWGEEYKELVKRAKDKNKIGLIQYDICDLIGDADVTKLNNWIETASDEDYESFLTELNEADEKKIDAISDKLRRIKLFKFTNGFYRSWKGIVFETWRYDKNRNARVYHLEYNNEPSIYVVSCLEGMEHVLDSLGINHSAKNLSSYPNIKRVFSLPDNEEIFRIISQKVSERILSLEEKKTLISHLAADAFAGIGPDKIASLKLCYNNKGERVSLSHLVRKEYPGHTVPEWLTPYQIKDEEYFEGLNGYLLKWDAIYDTIVHSKWDELKVTDNTKVKAFYSEVSALYKIAKEKKSIEEMSRIYTEDGEYKLPSNVFCLQRLSNNDSISYKDLAEGLKTVFGKSLPKKELLPFLKEEPFKMEDKKITGLTPTLEATSISGIEALVDAAGINNETFFNVFSISKAESGFIVKTTQASCPQAYTDKEEVLQFISANCKDCFTLLPKELSKYSGCSGVLLHESLYRRILDSTSSSFDTIKESLIDIVSYDSVKVDFLMKLKSISLDLDKTAEENAFAIKAFKMAAKVLESEEKRKSFRGSISFLKDGVSTPLRSIPTSASSVFRCEGAKKDFDIAKLLPNEYGNGGLLRRAVDILQKEGISLQDIHALLGISDSPDQDEIYVKLKEHYKELVNTQQLAFAILMGNGGINQSGLLAYARNGKAYKGSFVVANHSFISETYNLDKRYKDLGEYLSLPLEGDTFINDCYINDKGSFVALSLETNTEGVLDYVKVIDLLDFLYDLRLKNKETFKSVNWSSIQGSLGFDPTSSAYPGEYASSNEKLPDQIEAWAHQKEEVEGFFADMGMLTENMTEISFRKFMTGIPVQYSDTDIYSCQIVKRVEESLQWLAGQSVFPLSSEMSGHFLKAVEQINKLRKTEKRAEIVITDSFDFASLEESSVEYEGNNYAEWSEETGITVFLYDGHLPKTVSIDEYITGIAVQYVGTDNVADNEDQNAIYVNRQSDLQAELHILAKDNTVGLTNEMVYKLFDASIASMRAEIEEYKKKLDLMSFGNALMRAESPNELGKSEQIESNEEARTIVMERLQEEGFTFNDGIGRYASISGVIDPDGKPVKIVVKSALAGTVFIHPNEWADLLTPGAQLWLHTRGGTYPIHIREMIRQQDKINLSIDTANLDSGMGVSKIATLMQWMKAIHFEFNSIVPTHRAEDYHEYAFDDRSMDEKPTADDFPV